jgi:MinD superfamily P-loop ATPase
MRIAVASGKGGTGKTTIATSLVRSLISEGIVSYTDCDVEAPNGHLFLHPKILESTEAVVRIPRINKDKCSLCGRCVEVCQFHALAKIGRTIMVFPQLCHGCGSCTWNCPDIAIEEVLHPIGLLESGLTEDGIRFNQGLLTISEPMATPIIRQLKKFRDQSENTIEIFDAPPGASCSVVETLRKSDFVLLVTEPTPFGLHDLKQVKGIIDDMQLEAGVVINKDDDRFLPLTEYCKENSLPVLMRIPFERKIAEGIAQGLSLIEIYPAYREKFIQLFNQVQSLAQERCL